MNKITGRYALFFFSLIIAFATSCDKKEENTNPPTITLLAEDGYVTTNTAVAAATSIKFMVSCKSNGTHVLTNIIASSNGNRFVDEGINTHELNKEVVLTKNTDELEVIEFTIRDINGHEASLTLNVELDENGGDTEPIWYQNITLNAQSTDDTNGFFSLADGTIFSLQDAFNNQSNIHMLYYFDTVDSDSNTISSPGANIDESIFPGEFSLVNWTTRNTTRFLPVSMSQEEFEAINSTVFLVESYTATGNRKAKNLEPGLTFSFKDESRNKFGMFRVNSLTGEETGEINISIVVQP